MYVGTNTYSGGTSFTGRTYAYGVDLYPPRGAASDAYQLPYYDKHTHTDEHTRSRPNLYLSGHQHVPSRPKRFHPGFDFRRRRSV